jgi:outer membrane protein TolC
MKRVFILLLGTLAAVIAGCVDQDKEVAKYRQVLCGPATMPATMPSVLTLPQAMQMANTRNEQLAMSGEDYLQALIDVDRVIATFLPTISLQPSYFQTQTVPLPPAAKAFFPLHAADVPLNSQVNVFNGFRDVAALKGAAVNIEQRKALLKDLQSTLLVEVAQVYYQVLRAEKLALVLDNSVKVQEDRVRYLQNQFDAGVARKVDLLQAQAQAAATRVSLVTARKEAANGRATLAFLIGAERVECPLADRFEVPDFGPVELFEQQAQTDRQDLAAAIAGVGVAKQGVEQAVGQYYPSISIDFNRFLHRESFPTDSEWNVVFAANLPIFSGGRIHADVRAALSRLRQAKLNESLVSRQIVENVHIAYEDLTSSAEALVELRTQLSAAEEGYHQAAASYEAGTGTNLEALIAQDQWLRAQVQLASQEFEYKVAYLTLIRAAGQLSLTSPAGGAMPAAAPTTMPMTQPVATPTTEPTDPATIPPIAMPTTQPANPPTTPFAAASYCAAART